MSHRCLRACGCYARSVIGILIRPGQRWNLYRQATNGGGEIIPLKTIVSLGAASPRRGDKLRQVAVGIAVGGEQHNLRPALQPEPGANQQLEFVFLGRDMRTHHAGERTFIGNRQRRVTKCGGPRDQLLRMRCAAQKAEIAHAMQLGIIGKNGGHQVNL